MPFSYSTPQLKDDPAIFRPALDSKTNIMESLLIAQGAASTNRTSSTILLLFFFIFYYQIDLFLRILYRELHPLLLNQYHILMCVSLAVRALHSMNCANGLGADVW